VRFAAINAEKAQHAVTTLCRVLGVTRSGYYAWLRRGKSARERRNDELSDRILAIHKKSRGTYGCPRIQAELSSQGHRVSRKRVAHLMGRQGIKARKRKAWVPKTTDSRHGFPAAPNLLDRKFKQVAPNQVWVGDITYLRTGEGWLYLATLLDLYSRKVIGWSMSDTIDRHLVLGALEMAVVARRPPVGLIHHTDRGSQYASLDYRNALKRHGIVPSMSRTGNCWDNAVAESFFSTLKTEVAREHPTRAAARLAVFEYIEAFYNRQRRHSAIGYDTPVGHEDKFTQEVPQCA